MATKIAILSDTHGLLRPEVLDRIAGCDDIIHGGDINKPEIIDRLKEFGELWVDVVRWVIRGSGGKGRFVQEITFAIMTVDGSNTEIEKITIPHT